MPSARSQFTGAAGQFHLARELALRGINAALTVGNAPSVDVVASSSSGLQTIAFQVKTSRNAYRRKRYGVEGYEWDVNRDVIGKHSASFWYAFVNLREANGAWSPEVFFVPSRWVAEFVKPNWGRFMYFLPSSVIDLTQERWDLVSSYLLRDSDALAWAVDWPESRLTKWGVQPPPPPHEQQLIDTTEGDEGAAGQPLGLPTLPS